MSQNPDKNPQNPLIPISGGVSELLAAGRSLGTVVQSPSGFAPTIIVPESFRLEKLPPAELPPLPDHIRQAVELNDAESFGLYVKRYLNGNTVLFATLPDTSGQGGKFKAVFDYHTAQKAEEVGWPSAARRCAHVAVYPCPTSEPWNLWMGISGKPQNQQAFCDFVDANAPDIVSPASADLLEMAMNFEARTDVQFAAKVDRVTGGRSLKFTETVDAGRSDGGGGTIKVPAELKLRLPVFEGGAAFDVEARLEWRPKDGKLTVTVHLRRASDIVRKAMAVLRAEIQEDTGLTPFTGSVG